MSFGDARAGTPRRIQHGIARPELIKPTFFTPRSNHVRAWYERRYYTGQLTAEQATILEQLIEDLDRG